MKVLILSCNTGEGHNSSAMAIKHAMDAQGIECDKEDTLALVSEYVSRKASDIYVYTTKQNLFGVMYKIGSLVSNTTDWIKSPVYLGNKLYAEKLYRKIVDGGYTAVVCTHLFPAEALTALRKKAQLTLPVVFVMTDYTCIPFLTEVDCDAYVIPHEHLIEEFAEKGIPREKIYPYGIPVNEALFTNRIPKDEARSAMCAEFGWEATPEAARWLLIMGGSMGFGKVGDLLEQLQGRLDTDDRIICVCGRNEELVKQLNEEYADDARIKAIGYTDKVSTLMDASDVLFSKPGGITSTEAAIKHIPFIHTAPIPGVENHNFHFFHFHGMSYATTDVKIQAEMALRLCDEPERRQRMIEAQTRESNPHTCAQIIELVEALQAQRG